MKFFLKFCFTFSIIIASYILFIPSHSHAASNPWDVESYVKSGWNSNWGGKTYSMTSGKKIVYDVYNKKFTDGGYKIVTKNFGNGSQPYLNFQGWAILFGYKRHTTSNHDTYIVARNESTGAIKVYGTIPINISATEDLEYNNLGSGVYNECPSYYTNKNNETCNMRYDRVGFNAYLPLKELFPNQTQNEKWRLYIVKRVDRHLVYTYLKLPFDFNNHSYNGGTISLSSGIYASNLRMVGTNVIRRTKAFQSGVHGWQYGYFTEYKIYKRVSQNESSTAVWYGVSSPEDGYRTRWANTAYWDFGGDQAEISYDAPPEHVLAQVSNYRYKSGNDYWFQPYDQGYIRLEQHDTTGNKYQYLRLLGSGQDIRSRHNFSGSSTYNYQFFTSSHLQINSAYREKNYSYGQVNWGIVPKVHGDSFNVEYYYEDTNYNTIGYNDTGLNIRVDGAAPEHRTPGIYNARYVNGSTYWVRPNDTLSVQLNSYETLSGHDATYLRLYGSGNDDRAYHSWHESSGTYHEFNSGEYTDINGGYSPYFGWTAEYRFNVLAKSNSHGRKFNIQSYYRDNAGNTRGYINTGYYMAVDGVAPTVTPSSYSRGWSNANMSVSLSYSDPDSGVATRQYQWSNSTSTPSSWNTYSGTVTQSSSGVWYLHYRTVDHVGNVRTGYYGPYRVDKGGVGGYFSPNSSGWTNQTITSTFHPTDSGGSGVNYWIYRVSSNNGSTWSGWSSRIYGATSKGIPMSSTSIWKLQAVVYDNAGNSAWVTSGSFYIDKTPPGHTSFSISGARYVNSGNYWVRPNDTLHIKLKGYDSHSGLRHSYLRVSDGSHDDKAYHDWYSYSTQFNEYSTSSVSDILGVNETYESGVYKETDWTWKALSNSNNIDFWYIQTYYRDVAGNTRGFIDLPANIKVDGDAPSIQFRNYDDTTDFNSRNWDTSTINVRLKFSDGRSGYKYSRYAWTQSTSTPTTWSSWTTSANYVVSKSNYGQWYLHVQSVDNVGNVRTTYKGPYKFNDAPTANFQFDKSKYYVGDTAQITDLSSDPNGNPLTYKYTITAPNGRVDTKTIKDFSYYFDQVGDFKIKLEVQDSNGAKDSITKIVSIYDLTLSGTVSHSPKWLDIHQKKGNLPNQFYSGEDFILAAVTTDYPAYYVKATLTGRLVNGNMYSRSTTLSQQSNTSYTGIFDGEDFIEKYPLSKGFVPIEFEVKYQNGQIRTYTAQIEIIDNALNAMSFHRLY